MLSALMVAVLAQAEVEALTAPPPPPAEEPTVPAAFFDDVLSWDLDANQALKGKQRTALTRNEFYERVGRVDLIEKSNSLRSRRIGLVVSAGALAVGGTIAGVLVLSRSPDMNSSFCVANTANFNQCHDTNRVHQTGGIGVMAGSYVAAMLLATLAWWSNPDVLDGDEAIHLVSQYNAGLLKRLRASKGSLKWLPLVSPDGAQLAVTGRF